MTYDDDEGADTDMPERCWDAICDAIAAECGTGQLFALVWLDNLVEEDE